MGTPRHLPLPVCLVALTLAQTSLRAQTVVGRVLDDVNNAPLSATTIMLLDSTDVAVSWAESDSTGRFVLEVPRSGRYRVYADRLGYGEILSDTVPLRDPGPVELELRMVPMPIELDAVVVTAERRRARLEKEGFYRRMERSMGYFLDTDKIEALEPNRASDLLRGLPGIVLRRSGTGALRPMTLRMGKNCPMKVVLDGLKIDLTDDDLDHWVSAREVIGVEVYPGGGGIGAPIQNRGTDAFCGVVMIWTR